MPEKFFLARTGGLLVALPVTRLGRRAHGLHLSLEISDILRAQQFKRAAKDLTSVYEHRVHNLHEAGREKSKHRQS